MRTSSIKKTVSALAIALIVALAVPIADARPARGSRSGKAETIFRAAISFLKKIGGYVANAGPSVPLGDEDPAGAVAPAPTPTEDTNRQL